MKLSRPILTMLAILVYMAPASLTAQGTCPCKDSVIVSKMIDKKLAKMPTPRLDKLTADMKNVRRQLDSLKKVKEAGSASLAQSDSISSRMNLLEGYLRDIQDQVSRNSSEVSRLSIRQTDPGITSSDARRAYEVPPKQFWDRTDVRVGTAAVIVAGVVCAFVCRSKNVNTNVVTIH
jgi:hypothetical protein